MTNTYSIPQANPSIYFQQYRETIIKKIEEVLNSGCYINGEQVELFEKQFAQYCNVKHAVGVANGTDAIELTLRALNIGPGDLVFTVSHTAVASLAKLMYCPLPGSATRRDVTSVWPDVIVAFSASAVGITTWNDENPFVSCGNVSVAEICSFAELHTNGAETPPGRCCALAARHSSMATCMASALIFIVSSELRFSLSASRRPCLRTDCRCAAR